MPLPTFPTLGRTLPRRQQQPAYQETEQDESGLLSQIGGSMLSGLGMLGNALDLPGSMVRDVLVGENPFDQWLSPLSFENRATGRQLLERLGMRKNVESGIGGWVDDPGEGVRDVAGFGAEVLLDPLSYLTFGGAALGRGGQAAKRAGLLPMVDRLRKGGMRAGSLTENAKRLTQAGGFVGPRQAKASLNIEDLIRASTEPAVARESAETAARAMGVENFADIASEPLGKQFGLALPFGDPFVSFNAPGGAAINRGLDVAGNVISKSAPARFLRGLFDPAVEGQFGRVEQEIHELASEAKGTAGPIAKGQNLDSGNQYNELVRAFDDEVGGNLLDVGDEFHPDDLRLMSDEVRSEFMQDWELNQQFRDFRNRNRSAAALARNNPELDWASLNQRGDLPRFDEEWAENFGPGSPGEGLGIDSPEDLWNRLRDPADPRPTRNMDDVQAEARARLSEMQGSEPFGRGDVVRAGDRGNYGYVVRPGQNQSQVYFRNPETGAVQVRNLPNDQLNLAHARGTEEAAGYAGDYSRNVASDVLRATTELGSAEQAFREIAPDLAPSPELVSRFDQLAESFQGQRNAVYQQIEDLGGKSRWLEGTLNEGDSFRVEHYPRYVDKKTAKELSKGRALPAGFDSMKARTLETKNLPAHVRDRILTDNTYRGENAARNIERDFGEYLSDDWGRDPEAFDFGDLADEAAEGVGRQAHAQAIADWASGKPRLRLTGDAFKDQSRYIEKATATRESLGAIHDVMARYARPDIEGVALTDAMRQAGLNPVRGVEAFARRHGMSVADARALKVPDEMVNGAKSVIEYFNKGPLWQGKVADFIDGFTKWFKTSVTVPFPGFLSRNLLSGQHLNAATAFKSPMDFGRYASSVKYAKDLRDRVLKAVESGDGIAALPGKDQEFLKQLYQHGVVSPDQMFEVGDVLAASPRAGDPLADLVPGPLTDIRGAAQRAGEFVSENPIRFDPFDTMATRTDDLGRPLAPSLDDIKGAKTLRKGWRTWVETGTQANRMVEWMNRAPLYDFFRNKGYAPAQAAKEVISRHFDYGSLSPFSRDVAKRVFPFWTFTSKVFPLIGKELLERPGGGIGQTIRATNRAAGGQDEPLPQHVRETSAIPLGESDDGTLRFLTGLGLAHEDPASFLGQQPFRSAGVEAVSRANPLLKAPLEWITGESFFQRGPMGGRDLSDMDPLVGRLLTNIGLQEEDPVSGRAKEFIGPRTEQALANSPITRLLSTARQVTDSRKFENPTFFPGDAWAVNFLTGLKTTDVSPASQDAVVRDMVAPVVMDQLGGRSYENRYIPKQTIQDAIDRGETELAARMEAFNRLNRLLASRAKKRKQEKNE